MNKQILRMQKLAGLITEGQYRRLNEAFDPFLDTNMGGWIREYIDDVVEDSMGEPDSLDLRYRSDFDIAFDLALTRLQNHHPELDFNAIEANKESFWLGKS